MVTQPKTSNQFARNVFKADSKRAIQKTEEKTAYFFVTKKSNGITKVSKISEQNNSEKVTNKSDKEIPKEKYVSLEERQNIIDDLLRLM